MRTHITVKNATWGEWDECVDIVVPVSSLMLDHSKELDINGEGIFRAHVISEQTTVKISKEEYYRLKNLLTDRVEELDGELAKD